MESNKKTKKGRFVPSRYQQSAEGFPSRSSQLKPEISSLERTEVSSTVKYGKFLSSTPAPMGTSRLPSLEESAIPEGHDSTVVASTSGATEKRTGKAKSNEGKPCNPKGKLIQPSLDEEEEIDILYAEYLQTLLFETKLKESLEARSNNVLKELCALWQVVNDTLEIVRRLENQINKSSYYLAVHQNLQTQEKILTPIAEILPQIEKEYEAISHSVDLFKHKLPTTDLENMDTESIKNVFNLLQQVSVLMSCVRDAIPHKPELSSTAAIAEEFAAESGSLHEEVKRMSAQILELKDRIVSEMSLKLNEESL